MKYIPAEIWTIILKNIPYLERIKYCLVCKQWNEIIYNIGLTKLERFEYKEMLKYYESQHIRAQNNYTRYTMDTVFTGKSNDPELREILLRTMKNWYNNYEKIKRILEKYE